MLREITLEDVKFTINARQCDEPPEFALKHMKEDDEQNYKHTVQNIRQSLDYGNEWAWCDVTITGRFGPLEADATLCQCSYDNMTDFIDNSGYFNDLRNEVIAALNCQVRSLVGQLEAKAVVVEPINHDV